MSGRRSLEGLRTASSSSGGCSSRPAPSAVPPLPGAAPEPQQVSKGCQATGTPSCRGSGPGRPVAAAARGDHRDDVAGLQGKADLGRQLLAVVLVAAQGTWTPALAALRAVASPVGQQGQGGWLEDADRPDDPVAASMRAAAAAPGGQLEALDPHRVLELERLDGGVEGVAHADVDARRTGPGGARSLAAPDGLVVGPPAPADVHVVHGPLPVR